MNARGRAESAAELDALVAGTRGIQPWRRAFHAVSGLLLAYAPALSGLTPETTALLLAGGFVVLLAFDLARLRSPALNRLFFRSLSRLASPAERHRIASSTWYVLGACLVWAFFPLPVAQASLVILGLADPAASVVGRLFGRIHVGKGTVEGSLAFVTVGFLCLWPLVGPGPAALAALIAGLAEVLPLGIDDNLLVPLIAGSVLLATMGRIG